MNMRMFLGRAMGAAAAVSLSAVCLAQPSNDDCASAIDVFVGVEVNGTTAAATATVPALTALNTGDCTQTATFNLGSHFDIFYKFVAPATAAYTINTCGSTMPDTVLTVNTACPITQATLIACNDDSTSSVGAVGCVTTNPGSNNFNSRIASIVFTAGETYWIGVGGYNGATGSFTLRVNYLNTVGSCCGGSSCVLTDSANCAATYADGGTCTPNPCSGACCRASPQRCSLAVAANCTSPDVFLGTGISCSPNPCTATASGVCCRGSTCNTTVIAANCTGNGLAGAVHTGTGSSCNAVGTTSTPCCYPDYNKLNGVGVPDIFDFLNDWFAGSPFANFAGDGSPATVTVQHIFDFLNAWFAGGC